ncbi:MAG: ribbon-helix-helix protein, CopG family [Synergistaceae bacterium]|nr:ribbon-helix-helix protein, CopG family [Synergistaceae bacterium]
MIAKALSFRADENEVARIKKAASDFGMSVAGLIREAVRDYIVRETFYRNLENVEEASPEESAEILAMIEDMTEDDEQIMRIDSFTVQGGKIKREVFVRVEESEEALPEESA